MSKDLFDAALRAVQNAQKQLRPADTTSLVLFNHHVARSRTLSGPIHLPASGGTSLVVSKTTRSREGGNRF